MRCILLVATNRKLISRGGRIMPYHFPAKDMSSHRQDLSPLGLRHSPPSSEQNGTLSVLCLLSAAER